MSQPQTTPKPPALQQRFEEFDKLITQLGADICQLEDTRRRHALGRQYLVEIVSAYDGWVPFGTREERLLRAARVYERVVAGKDPDEDPDEDLSPPIRTVLLTNGPHARFLFKNIATYASPIVERLALAAARYCDWIHANAQEPDTAKGNGKAETKAAGDAAADEQKTAPATTMPERIRLSACTTPATSTVIADRLGVSRQYSASNLSLLRRRGMVSYRDGIYGPPDKAGAAA
jgi:hypothetical protein